MRTSLNQVLVPFCDVDLDHDAAGALRRVPAGLERHPRRDVVGDGAADPVDHAGDVVDEAVSNVDVVENADVLTAHRDPAQVAGRGASVVGDLEIVHLDVLDVEQQHRLEIGRAGRDARSVAGPVAIDDDGGGRRARALRRQLAGPDATRLEADRVARLQRRGVHLGQGLPGQRRRRSVVGVPARGRVDVVDAGHRRQSGAGGGRGTAGSTGAGRSARAGAARAGCARQSRARRCRVSRDRSRRRRRRRFRW